MAKKSRMATFLSIELKHVVFYSTDIYPRIFHPPNPQKWNDNNVAVKDQYERMSGYTYFGIIDHDEFLIPTRNRSLKQMMVSINRLFAYCKDSSFNIHIWA